MLVTAPPRHAHEGNGSRGTGLHYRVGQGLAGHYNLQGDPSQDIAGFRALFGVENIARAATTQNFDMAHPADVLVANCTFPIHFLDYSPPLLVLPSPSEDMAHYGTEESIHDYCDETKCVGRAENTTYSEYCAQPEMAMGYSSIETVLEAA